MRVGILETGRPPKELAGTHGTYPEMAASWLGTEARFYAVLDGVFPKSPDAADVWVLTGSRFGVYEDHPFIAPLEKFVRQCVQSGKKLVGICFGHQLIAQALGGKVEQAAQGWGLGLHDYQIDHGAAPEGFIQDSLRMQVLHQDQVTRAPEEAQIFARSAFCPIAGLWYPGQAITVQGHPEFDASYCRAVLELRRGKGLPAEIVDKALAGLDAANNRAELSRFVMTPGAW